MDIKSIVAVFTSILVVEFAWWFICWGFQAEFKPMHAMIVYLILLIVYLLVKTR